MKSSFHAWPGQSRAPPLTAACRHAEQGLECSDEQLGGTLPAMNRTGIYLPSKGPGRAARCFPGCSRHLQRASGHFWKSSLALQWLQGWSPWCLFLAEPAESPAGWQEALPGRHPMISARPQGWDGRPPPRASGGDGQGQDSGCLPRAWAPHPAWHPRHSLPASTWGVEEGAWPVKGQLPGTLLPVFLPGRCRHSGAPCSASPRAMGPIPTPGTPKLPIPALPCHPHPQSSPTTH